MSYSHQITPPGQLPALPVTEFEMAVRSVKIELLDAQQKFLNRVGTGFVFAVNDVDYLFTCWHVFTGYDFLSLEVKNPPNRRFARITCKEIVRHDGGRKSLGGVQSVILPLYDDENRPLWRQQEQTRPQEDLATQNILVPEFADMAALRIEIPRDERMFRCYTENDVDASGMTNGSEIIITGYPWGYSALGDQTPEPIFLSRHIASWVLDNPQNILLDGVGASGMSGSPVFRRWGDKFKLMGMYAGAYHPDVQATGRPQDSYSSLGIVVRFGARNFFRF